MSTATSLPSASRLALIGIGWLLPGAALGGDLLAIHWNTGDLYRVSTSNAALTLIGNTGVSSIGGLALAPNGRVYAMTTSSGSTLYEIDPNTAAATAIGPLNVGFVFEGALAFAPTGAAYGANAGNQSNPLLVGIDPQTGAGAVIGTISGGSHDINGLVWRSDGKLVGLDGVSNALLEIDPATAASTFIAPMIVASGLSGDMALDGNTAYIATGGSGPGGSNELLRVDLYSGAQTLIGSFGPSITGVGITGLAGLPASCPGDLNGDGRTDLTDLGILLADFGCPQPGPCVGDLDGDGDTDLADLGILLADFGCGTP
jgi:hypothetical protein